MNFFCVEQTKPSII